MTRIRARNQEEDDRVITPLAYVLDRERWLWTHSRRSDQALTMGTPGVPDIIAVRNGLLLTWECKSATGTVSAAQHSWLQEFANVRAIDPRIVRPRDVDEAIRLITGGKP
jgi:hypothetical protein